MNLELNRKPKEHENFTQFRENLRFICEMQDEDFCQVMILGYLRAAKHDKSRSSKASYAEIERFVDWAAKLRIEWGLLCNILDEHISAFVKKDQEEPCFRLTSVGKKYVEENILT